MKLNFYFVTLTTSKSGLLKDRLSGRPQSPIQLSVFSARHARRVPGNRAPGPAATQRGATPSQAAGPAESPTEQVLCRYQRGEKNIEKQRCR